jgi:uncharacterized membrane protein
LIEFYREFAFIIVPIHTLSVAIWLGGMIVFIVALCPALRQIPNEKMMIRTSLRALGRFFAFTFVFVFLIGISGYMMEIAKDFGHKEPTLEAIVGAKEIIWSIMLLIFIYAFYKVFQSKLECLNENVVLAKHNLKLIVNYLFVTSVILGVVALYLGLLLRGA